MRFTLMVTGPAYGTQQASSALQFANAILSEGHDLTNIFFYCDGVYNANKFTAPASDEFDLVRAWYELHKNYNVKLHLCISAALRRGIVDVSQAQKLKSAESNIQNGFFISGLGSLAQSLLICDRMVQF